MCQFEADDGVVDEALAEGLALVCVLDALFVAHTGKTQTLDDDTNTLVVEVLTSQSGSVNKIVIDLPS